METRFHDRHERINYLKVCEVAQRIIADPALIKSARRFVERLCYPIPIRTIRIGPIHPIPIGTDPHQ